MIKNTGFFSAEKYSFQCFSLQSFPHVSDNLPCKSKTWDEVSCHPKPVMFPFMNNSSLAQG